MYSLCIDYHFNGSLITRTNVSSLSGALECLLHCLNNECCRSVNFLKTEVNKEKGNCELLSVLAKDHLKLLTENRNYDYIVLTQPERVSDYII